MTVAEIVAELQHLGMSAYEAKAYTALVASGTPLTGYEVAKRSRIPRSTIYETLGKLTKRGAAYEVRNNGDSVAYIALPPQALLDRTERDVQRSVEMLKVALPEIIDTPQVRLIHNIDGRQPLLDRVEDIIAAAKSTLFVSGWPSEIQPLKPALQTAQHRGVDISIVIFGADPEPVGHTIEHRYSSPEVAKENLGCQLLVLASDRDQAVIGGLDRGQAWGIYTDDTAVVLVAIEYVRHDMALHLIAENMDTESFDNLWRNNPDIRRLRNDHGAAAAHLARSHGSVAQS